MPIYSAGSSLGTQRTKYVRDKVKYIMLFTQLSFIKGRNYICYFFVRRNFDASVIIRRHRMGKTLCIFSAVGPECFCSTLQLTGTHKK